MTTESQEPTLQQGIDLHAAGRLDEAEDSYRTVLAKDPEHTEALYLLGKISAIHKRNLMRDALVRLKNLGFTPSGVLDIGAYQGSWAKLCRSVFPTTPLLMIEAQREQENQLVQVCAELGSDVTVRNVLLGKENRSAATFYRLNTRWGSTGSSIYREITGYNCEKQQLPMVTLDSLLDGDLKQYQLLKLDVQGAECDILEGATGRIEDAEVLIIESSLLPWNENAPLLHECISFLAARGFVLFDIAGEHRTANERLLQIDGVFVREESVLRKS